MRKSLWAAAAATLFISTAALATITFDPETGEGWVGKGDVQIAFGWNNATMQSKHLGVTFGVDNSVSYDVTCEWDTVTGKESKTIHHEVTNHHDIVSSAALDSTSRKTGQYTGWFLNGYAGGGSLDDVDLPQVGAACPQGGGFSDNDPSANDAVVTSVDNVVGGGGTLTAYSGTSSRVIYTF